MYIIGDIAYADDPAPLLQVSGVRPLDDYQLWIRFSTGDQRIFDMKSLLDAPAFMPLKDKTLFNAVYIDFGTVTWDDGRIDIAPEMLYEKGLMYGG